MILLDDSKILSDSYSVDGVYHTGNHHGSYNVDSILLDGVLITGVISCDINKGFLIRNKTDATGKLIVTDSEIVYELLTGKVEVTFK